MKTFEFKSSKVKVVTDSGEITFRFPTMAEASEFDKNLVSENVDHDKLIEDYLVALGLPAAVYKELEYWQVKDLLSYFRDPTGKESKAQT
jgi:hypothetical protein